MPIKVAYDLILSAQKKMLKNIEFYENPDNKSTQIGNYLINLFTNSEMVQNEYPGGLNLTVIAPLDESSPNGSQELN